MREIKFRAWDKEEKVWIDKFYVADEGYAMGVMGNYFPEEIEPLENIILCQYTGLKDKNGKEIYEGDILEDSFGRRAKCLWFEPNSESMPAVTGLTFVEIKKEAGGWSVFEKSWLLFSEVIGNIYENPELLK